MAAQIPGKDALKCLERFQSNFGVENIEILQNIGITGGKNTIKRVREIRDVMNQMTENYSGDDFTNPKNDIVGSSTKVFR